MTERELFIIELLQKHRDDMTINNYYRSHDFTIGVIEDTLANYNNPLLILQRCSLPRFVNTIRSNHKFNPFAYNQNTQEYNLYGLTVPVEIYDNVNTGVHRLLIIERDKNDKFNYDKYIIIEDSSM